MSLMAITIGLVLIALIGGVAYWFATIEQRTMKPGPDDLDEHMREAKRRASSSITNVNPP